MIKRLLSKFLWSYFCCMLPLEDDLVWKGHSHPQEEDDDNNDGEITNRAMYTISTTMKNNNSIKKGILTIGIHHHLTILAIIIMMMMTIQEGIQNNPNKDVIENNTTITIHGQLDPLVRIIFPIYW